MSYWGWKFAHIIGVVLLVGNVSVTSVWKVFADRTGDSSVVSFAQRLVVHTDWSLTGGGVLLVILGGYGMTWQANMSLTQMPWLFWGQILFLLSGMIWLFVLIPIQTAQSRLARAFGVSGISEAYRQLSRTWIRWGVAATVPLVIATYLMVAKTF